MPLLAGCIIFPGYAQNQDDSFVTSWANSPYMLGDWHNPAAP